MTVTGNTFRILVAGGEPTGLLVAEIRSEGARLGGVGELDDVVSR